MKFDFNPPILQHAHHLSLVKIYCLSWMIARGRKSITLNEILEMKQLKNLHNEQQFKELKQLAWSKPGVRSTKAVSIDDVLYNLPHHDRFEIPSKKGFHPQWRDRLLLKAKKIHTKHISKIKAYADLVKPRQRSVMTFELNHADALRCESAMCVNFEVYRMQNGNATWPSTSSNDNMKFGWIVYRITSDTTIHITELQSPPEMVNVTKCKEAHYFIEPPNWTGFMLQQFIQHFTLRGYTRFTIPTVEKRKSHLIDPSKIIETNYRDLPRAFGFEKEDNGWWWLDFNR